MSLNIIKNSVTWYDFFNDCFLYANKKAPENDDFVKITRFDLALDEQYNPQEGNFDLFKLLTSAREGRWNGRKQNLPGCIRDDRW